ncbi:MAG: hypothetical protein IID33_06245 [Planctomycetes bacterium]|nr:hypothetical protein [Planctomycetota bacterium]
MFENRLKWFSILLAVVAGVIVLRLGEIQIIRAGEYDTIAEEMLKRPVRSLRAVRGSILDRQGKPLVEDVGAYDIGVHYAVLAISEETRRELEIGVDYRALPDDSPTKRELDAVARGLRRGEGRVYARSTPTIEIVDGLAGHLAEMWERLSQLNGLPLSELVDRSERICRRVDGIRRIVKGSIAEEYMFHPLLEGCTSDLAVTVRMEISDWPWVRVMPSSRRVTRYDDADPMAHILGRMGAVSEKAIEADPFGGDPRRELRRTERYGVSGVERMAEAILRGKRGVIEVDFDRTVIRREEQERGTDVTLTIDADLQRDVLAILGKHVESSKHPAGGAAVVIDVQTREILAMVSYPSYSIADFSTNYDDMRRDTRRMPLLSRCVSGRYPPGSICKLVSLYGALADGKTSAGAEIECRGYLYNKNSYRCWIFRQYNDWHGVLTAEEAIKHSCNIYFYTIGERLGPERLVEWFDVFGLGRLPGTGLIDESRGILPTPRWLHNHPRPPLGKADARNYAIGQGEVTATPLQAANAAATVASGRWAPVKLLRDVQPPHDLPEAGRLLRDDMLSLIRRGMWRVVNDHDGTGTQARLDHPSYVMCGKTGSAQASRRRLAREYTIRLADESERVVTAATKQDALAQFDDQTVTIIGSRAVLFPDRLADSPSHAWFIGFTQPAGTIMGVRPRGRVYAIAVIIEYGGSGGKVAGPVAREVAEAVLAHEDL